MRLFSSDHRQLRRRGVIAVLGATLVISLAACGLGDSAGDPARTLQVRISEDPGALDPQTTNATEALNVASYMYDTIVGLDADQNVVSRLAESWKVTDSGVTFQLRDDVTCSDGTPLKPSDIAANLDRVKNPETENSLAANFLGSTEYKVAADDKAWSLSIGTPEPFGPLLYNLSKYPYIICPAGLEDPDSLSEQSHGTGPFVLDESVSGDHYRLTKRDGYNWGPDGASTDVTGFPTAVDLRVIPNDTTAANELVSGSLDLGYVSGAERERVESAAGLGSKETEVGVTTLVFNQREDRVTSDPAVRRALVQALDRSAMTSASFGTFGQVANSVLMPYAPCYDDAVVDAVPESDISAAEGELSKLTGPLKAYSIAVPGSEYLSEAWRAIGVETDLNVGDETGPGLDAVFGGGDWDAALVTFNSIDQLATLTPFFSGNPVPNGSNILAREDDDFAGSATAAAESMGDEACAQTSQALRTLFADGSVTPLSVETREFFSAQDVEFGFVRSTIDPTSLRVVDE